MKATRFLSSADAAQILGVTPARIRQMVRRGDLAASAMTEGGIRLFLREDIDAFAQSRRPGRRGHRLSTRER